MNEIDYLGHVISTNRVKANSSKIASKLEWPITNSLKVLRGLLGFTSYYGKFISHYGNIAAPLTHLLKKNIFI